MIFKKEKEKNIFNLIVILLIFSNFNIIPLFYKVSYSFLHKSKNELTEFIKKVSAVNQYIPAGEKVGFLTGVQPDEVFIDEKAIKKFFMTQYAIVPRVLENDFDTDYIIGIFDDLKAQKIYISRKFKVYKIINKDIIIFKRKSNG